MTPATNAAAPGYGQVGPDFVGLLRGVAGDRVLTGRAVCAQHGSDESYHPGAAPDVVVRVETTEEVAAVMRLCAARRIAVVAYGAGTSLEGHVAAVRGGVCIDLGAMDRVLQVRPADLDASVQAGVTREALNRPFSSVVDRISF